MKPLYLVDGHNLLYRAFFALPRLTAPDGRPTNVVFGFARVLLKILRDEDPGGVATVFDSREPTPRHALFPAYKANRLKQPEELEAQIPLVKELIDALGVVRIEMPGVEADDVIGTLARRAEEEGRDVIIVSSDKDLYQLVSSRVRIRDGLRDRLVGEKEVQEAFGVGPEAVVDLLALAGDPSDNVPGVPGIGEKTAAELIQKFGSLEGVLASAGDLSGAKRRRIEENARLAKLCRELVRIDRGVPIEVTPESLRPRGIDRGRALALFRELGFRKLIEELDLEKTSPRIEAAPTISLRVVEVRGAGEVERFLEEAGARRAAMAFPEGDAPRVAAVAAGGAAAVFPAEMAASVLSAVAEKGIVLCVFDGKEFLRRAAAVRLRYDLSLFDVQVAAYLLAPDEGTPSLAKVGERFLSGISLQGGKEETGAEEAARRARALLDLAAILEKRLEEGGLTKVFREVDMPLLPVLLGMEERGIRIAPALFAALSEELSEATRRIEEKVRDLAGMEVNLNSPKQLAFLLFEKLGLPPVRRTKTGYSTDVDVLEQIRGLHPIPALVLEYRSLAKIKSTYVDVLPTLVSPGDGRIHTTFHQTQTATGRLSSSDPNLQNIPVRTDLGRRIRSGFVAEPGWAFVGADYSQVELRLLAHLSRSEELIRTFLAGEDVHAATASRIFGISPAEVTAEHRRKAKVINFGILYGMSPFGLSRELGIGAKEAKRYIEQYFERYPGVRAYLDGVIEAARRDGFVQTIMGRRRYIPDVGSRNRVVREAAERMAVNTPIQGSAADLIKMAMIRVDREFRSRGMAARLVLQVHDELVAEAPESEAEAAAALLKETMESAAALAVPLTVAVAVGRTWGEIH